MGSYLSGFRNYSYYHIQAEKCYLHSRVLRRINTFHKVWNFLIFRILIYQKLNQKLGESIFCIFIFVFNSNLFKNYKK